MIFVLQRLTGRIAAMFYSKVSWWLYDLDLFGIGARAALTELWATLADVARCGDLAGHMVTWWDVIKGTTRADDRVYLSKQFGLCWAYNEYGRICGHPAIGIHPHGYAVCAEHLPRAVRLSPPEQTQE